MAGDKCGGPCALLGGICCAVGEISADAVKRRDNAVEVSRSNSSHCASQDPNKSLKAMILEDLNMMNARTRINQLGANWLTTYRSWQDA